jgi:UDP-glucose 4-epimerase
MLGSELAKVLPGPQLPSRALDWRAASLHDALAAGAAELEERTRRSEGGWRVCWCAGASVVGSSAADLEREVETLQVLLRALAAQPTLRERRGSFLLVSSAGGVHGGERGGARISERTAPTPISAYGRAKLAQEQCLAEHVARFAQLSTLTARLSNLYGTAQRLDKRQGLISHMARAVVQGLPVHIYVPLDTTRDYLFTSDAAVALAAGLARLDAEASRPSQVLKIYASERDTSIASLLAIFRSIAKRRLRVVAGMHKQSLEQPRHLAFSSEVWPEARGLCRTELIAGVGIVYRHLLRSFQLGGKFAPSPA